MLLRYTRLYWYFLVQRFKILMEYRVNFLIGASSTFFLQGSSILAIWVVMRQIPSMQGWSFPEVLLIYGLVTLAQSLNHMFADNLWTIGWAYIRSGQFDRFLVRPIDPLFHLLADRFEDTADFLAHVGVEDVRVRGLKQLDVAELRDRTRHRRGGGPGRALVAGGWLWRR